MKKKRNPLSLLEPKYPIIYYLKHPIKGAKDIYWNVRNFYHRGKYGYAYVDVWNWYHWWVTAGAEALRYLADHHAGYPGCDLWDTPKRWEAYLLSMADQLDWCAKSCEIDCHENRNEFTRMRNQIYEQRRKKRANEFEWDTTTYETTEAEDEVIRKYWLREEELTKEDEQRRAEIFAEIGRALPRFWD